MAIRFPFICSMFGHKIDRRRAWFDNLNWRSNCKHCNIPLIKCYTGWRPFVRTDFHEHRCSKDEAKMLHLIETPAISRTMPDHDTGLPIKDRNLIVKDRGLTIEDQGLMIKKQDRTHG